MAISPPRREKRIRQLTGPRVTESEEIAVLRLAHRLDTSASHVMRMALRELLQRHGFSFDDDDYSDRE